MINIENKLKWVLCAFLSIFLVACKPTAKFEYSPTAPSVGEVIKFDASKSTVYKAKEGNKIVSYAWNFGDNSQSTGQITEHTYTAAGQYTIQLSVTDVAGQTHTTQQKITVKQGTSTINKEVAVQVQTSDGSSIPNATVTIQGQSVKTDQNGLATLKLTLAQGTQQVVAKFEKEGFITQSIVYDVANLKAVSANLLIIKQVVPVADIATAQTIESKHLGATITIPANAFVKVDGSVATGAVTVEFTPWDITNNDLNAMPANGVAKDALGNIVNLISAGMITATFKDANGQELQLAAGKTADIQMNLPLKSINNTEMKIGTQIPMWHFDETQGLWVEEGIGQVVASTVSATGLAVHATVSHFSTWNWDFKFENAGSVFVQCQSNGVGAPCDVNALVTLNDGSKVFRRSYIPAEGATVINMPSSGSIHWVAKDTTETLIGEKNSGTTGNVIIDLGTPSTDNFVKCILPDGTTVACFGTMNSKFEFSVSKDGGRMMTGIQDPDNKLIWSAQTNLIFESNQWVRYKGSVISNMVGSTNITLTDREVVYTSNQGMSFPIVCTSLIHIPGTTLTTEPNGNWEVEPSLIGKPCTVEITISTEANDTETFTYNMIYGQPFQIQLPSKYSGFTSSGNGPINYLFISAQIEDENGDSLYERIGFEVEFEKNSTIKLFMAPPDW